jgi:hypothetical protein
LLQQPQKNTCSSADSDFFDDCDEISQTSAKECPIIQKTPVLQGSANMLLRKLNKNAEDLQLKNQAGDNRPALKQLT